MPCNHKFQKYLNLQRLDFEPTTLIVGTFNPEWPEGNYAEWFYGRTDNNFFWDLLPRMYGEPGLRDKMHTDWKTFCSNKKVALTDLLASIDDADIKSESHRKILGEYTDTALATKFKRHTPNIIVPLLQAKPNIRTVYLTTTNSSKFWQSKWKPVEEYCLQQGIWCRKLMTPSKGARFFMTKGSGIAMFDFIYNDWKGKWNRNDIINTTQVQSSKLEIRHH